VHLVRFTIEIILIARPCEHQMSASVCDASRCVRGERVRRNSLYAARTTADIYVPALALKHFH